MRLQNSRNTSEPMVPDPLTLKNFNIEKKMQTKAKTRYFFIPVRLAEPFQELIMLEIIGT